MNFAIVYKRNWHSLAPEFFSSNAVYLFIRFYPHFWSLGWTTIYEWKRSDISPLEINLKHFSNIFFSRPFQLFTFHSIHSKLHGGMHTKLRLTHKWGINTVATFFHTNWLQIFLMRFIELAIMMIIAFMECFHENNLSFSVCLSYSTLCIV